MRPRRRARFRPGAALSGGLLAGARSGRRFRLEARAFRRLRWLACGCPIGRPGRCFRLEARCFRRFPLARSPVPDRAAGRCFRRFSAVAESSAPAARPQPGPALPLAGSRQGRVSAGGRVAAGSRAPHRVGARSGQRHHAPAPAERGGERLVHRVGRDERVVHHPRCRHDRKPSVANDSFETSGAPNKPFATVGPDRATTTRVTTRKSRRATAPSRLGSPRAPNSLRLPAAPRLSGVVPRRVA